MARVVRDNSERMPLHASATSNGMAGKLMMLPSRKTGTPASGKTAAATFEARSWRGKVIWLNTIAGSGIISSKKAQGNSTARKKSHPRKKITSPAITSNNDTLEKKSSAPSTPDNSTTTAQIRMGNPQRDGAEGSLAKRARSFQSKNRENIGTKNPCEKLGSFDHCAPRCTIM